MRRWSLIAALLLCAGIAAAADAPTKIPQRSEIPDKDKWHIQDLYPSNDAWEADYHRLEGLIPRMAAFKGHVAMSGDSLLAALRMDDSTSSLSDNLTVFAGLRHDEDTRVTVFGGMRDRARNVSTKLGEAGSFLEPEIVGIPTEKLEGWYKSTPGLALYRHRLENSLRLQAHTLSTDEEKLLSSAGDMASGPADVFGAFDDADLQYGSVTDEKGNKVALSKGRYSRFVELPDRKVRREAFMTFQNAYKAFNNTLAATMQAHVNTHEFYARARKYNSAAEYALSGSNIPVDVLKSLIATVNANLGPLHRYISLRKKWLGLDTLHMYDLYVPVVPDVATDIPYDSARAQVLAGLRPLGDEYLTAFRGGLDGGWIDVYENEGKRSGAYNWGTYTCHPFLLMNYNNTLDAEFTLAHEMGHAMHSWFSHHNQPYVYGNYATFVAEVASTTNEALLANSLLQRKMSREQRLFLLNHLVEQFRATFFLQAMFGEFELRIHEMAEAGKPLTAEALNQTYHDLVQRYYGPDLYLDPEVDVSWSRIPHFYRNFYVYQYATSYAAATALSQKILTEGKPEVTRYLSYLKAGNSDYPIGVLKKAGVDMTTAAPFEATITRFSQVLDEMEKLWNSK